MIWRLILGALLFFCTQPLHAQRQPPFNPQQTPDYQWPTSASNLLSSTFAETRTGHLHAALDLKTWGVRGYPVFATRSGRLHRMAIGPRGYGKVLYLKHDDGSISLYAHLLRFSDRIQQVADSLRLARGANAIDVVTDSMNIRLQQGQQIALSGATGIGPPHLHFELRTPDNHPFNPLLTNLSITDTIAPTISGLAIEPLSPQTRISGENNITTFRRRGHTFGPISVSGPIGLGVDVFDQANGARNAYAAYKLTLAVDGQVVFESQADEFSYEQTDQIHLDRIYSLLYHTGRAYQRLFVADGNALSFYRTQGNGGKLNLAPGTHTLRIIATDYNGNSASSTVQLRVQPTAPKNLLQPFPTRKTTGQIDVNSWQWFNDWVNIPIADYNALTLSALFDDSLSNNALTVQNDETIALRLKNNPQIFFRLSPFNYFTLRRVYPNRPTYLQADNARAQAYFPAGTFFDTTSVALAVDTTAARPEVHLFPNTVPIHGDYTFSVMADSAILADSSLSFYQTGRGGRLYFKETTVRGDMISATASTMGTFVLRSDTSAPTLGRPAINRSPDNKWQIVIPVRDNLSGLDADASRMIVNGEPGLVEYDPDLNSLLFYLPGWSPQRENRIALTVYDRMGNRRQLQTTLRH